VLLTSTVIIEMKECEQAGSANPCPFGTSGMGDALSVFVMVFDYLVGFGDWDPASPMPEASRDT
jgi:hypothetical protein